MSVTYSPANPGVSVATITITGNSPTSPQLIPLSGTAAAPPAPAPVASFNSANPFNFPGQTTQGTSSTPQNITVSNTGNAPLHISGVALGGLNTSDFSVGNSNCSGAIAAAANCVIPVTFSPLAAGIRSITIAVTDDAANSPQVLTINGTAAPAASITPPNGQTTTASVTAGQTAQYNLTATPGAGFNGTLSFSCSGAPFGAQCTISPQTVPVANGAATNFTVSVATGSVSALMPAPITPQTPPQNDQRFPFIFLAALATICAFLFAIRFNKETLQTLRPRQIAFSLVLVLALVTSGIGCNSGGSTQSASLQPTVQAAAAPAITPNGGTFTTSYPTVTISDATPAATIHYTTDGSTPTTSSPTYTSAFTLNAAGNVQAIATASGYSTSSLATAAFKLQAAPGSYTITITPTATPNGSSKQLQMTPIQLTLNVN